jgi:NAD(P)-dependent dehydrogenase (short-subunit alcohol dehydrogenase family)
MQEHADCCSMAETALESLCSLCSLCSVCSPLMLCVLHLVCCFCYRCAVPLAGRVALITGASFGIGAATARTFAAAGAHLVLNGRNEQRLQAVADSIRKAHPSVQVETLAGDAGKEETHKALVELALSKFGALHVVFNNAGVFPMATMQKITAEQVDALLDTNVKSIVYGLKYQLPAIGKSASKDIWGVIVNNSSSISLHTSSTLVAAGVYAASKSAVDTLSKYGALEGAPLHVRVLALNIGPCASDGALSAFGGQENFDQLLSKATLIQPTLSCEDVAETVLFLSDSKKARFITGSTFLVDGGANIK